MLFILEGRFTISTAGPDGADVPLAVLRRSEFMGERGMLTGQQRTATARSQTAAVVLDVPEQVMQRMMEIVPAVRSYFEQLNNVRSIESVQKQQNQFFLHYADISSASSLCSECKSEKIFSWSERGATV